MMNCRTFESRLHDLLDRRELPGDDAQIQQHALRCPRCQDLLAASDQLWEGLLHWHPPALPADFSQRVVSAVDAKEAEPWTVDDGEGSIADGDLALVHPSDSPASELSSRRSRLTARRFWFGVLAAGLLIALLPGVRRHAGSDPNASRRPAAESRGQLATATPGPTAAPGNSVEHQVDDARYSPAAVTSSDGVALPWRSIFDEISKEVASGRLHSVTALAESLEPIRNSLATAIDSLRSAFPITRPSPANDDGAVHSAGWPAFTAQRYTA